MTPNMTDSQSIRETLERIRRVETRVTKIGQALDIDVGGGTPTWDDALPGIIIPSPNCSFGQVVQTIPIGHTGDVKVVHRGDLVATLRASR